MNKVVSSFSDLHPVPLKDHGNYTFKQFQRSYSGGYSMNFANALSGVVDSKTKNSSEVNISNFYKLTDIINIDNDTAKPSIYKTTLSLGDKYVRFYEIDPTPYIINDISRDALLYGAIGLSLDGDIDTLFEIEYIDVNVATISFTNGLGERFLLCSTSDIKLAFVLEDELILDNVIFRPQHFLYNYNPLVNGITLSKPDDYVVIVEGDSLLLRQYGSGMSQIIKNNTFILSRNVTDQNTYHNMNSSFITYTDSSLATDVDGIVYDKSNNFVIHRSLEDDRASIVFAKNRLDENGTSFTFQTSDSFTNNLNGDNLNNHRVYSAIFQDIDTKEDDTLNLGYVTYDRAYPIKTGYTPFRTPTSMYPYTSIDINDTSFSKTGAFYSDSPIYADKIRTDIVPTEDGYQYACTWLSGNFVDDAVWVDRYYYPNYIQKEEAISLNSALLVTYNEYVEDLIRNNSNFRDEIIKSTIFDKRSDMNILPDTEYVYDRLTLLDEDIHPECIELLDMYKAVNNSNAMSMDFTFYGSNDDWVLKSDRNDIDAGITITKSGTTIKFEYVVYIRTSGTYDTYVVEESYDRFSDNLFAFTFNSKNGLGYVVLNNKIILELNLNPYKYGQDRLLQGDFLFDGEFFTGSNDYIKTFILEDKSITKSRISILSYIRGITAANDMSIYIPCGQVNMTDSVGQLHTLCGNKGSKSDNITIGVGNLHIENNESLTNAISGVIINTFADNTPLNSSLNNITFNNYD